MKLALIAYPELSVADNHLIEECRKEHDELYQIIRPHFTFIFPFTGLSETAFIESIQPVLESTSIIPLTIRCTTINKDAFKPVFHTFLVTDEGNSNIIRLHDKLYQVQALQKHHKQDIDYIPHIVIASNVDSNKMKQLSDQWNSKKFMIDGKISCADIISLEENSVRTIKTIKLGKQ